ncbi:MAG: hypothetical protein U9Q83_01760 [Bacteroidota bacterium]|nr:hypothetical protein [Bacteroidota bacterium]
MSSLSHATLFSKLLNISDKSFYRWKSKDHKLLIDLLEKYFEDSDIKEFLETSEISRFEQLNQIKSMSDKICNDFFYAYYTRTEINRNFSTVIFPKFEKYILNNIDKKIENSIAEAEKANKLPKSKIEIMLKNRISYHQKSKKNYYTIFDFIKFVQVS